MKMAIFDAALESHQRAADLDPNKAKIQFDLGLVVPEHHQILCREI